MSAAFDLLYVSDVRFTVVFVVRSVNGWMETYTQIDYEHDDATTLSTKLPALYRTSCTPQWMSWQNRNRGAWSRLSSLSGLRWSIKCDTRPTNL